jgi:O-antigen/teichoic acid export membrane protein
MEIKVNETTAISINRKDVYWNYAATFLQIAAQALLLPFILRFLPQETIGIWTIFISIIAIVTLLDFGFNPSFTRNVTYILSGIKTLKATGFQIVEENSEIDYGLLKGLISVMRSFYSKIAFILFAVLTTAGTYYIFFILKTYSGDRREIITAWFILCLVNSYSFYTFYYDALLIGMGKIKRSKQIIIVGQVLYLSVSVILIFAGFGLIAITAAQAVSVVIRRILAYRAVYTDKIKYQLGNSETREKKEIFKAVYPNAVKMGLTDVGTVLALRLQPVIGSLFLPLETIASYGITTQLIWVLIGLGFVYFNTYQPKVVQYRVQNNISSIKSIYIRSCVILVVVFIFGGAGLLLFGAWGMNLIGSKTPLLPNMYIFVALLTSLLTANHGIAAGFLLAKNYVPFFKASIISGLLTILLLFLFLRVFRLETWSLILAGGFAQMAYQNWKWPLEFIKELRKTKEIKCFSV